MQANDRAVEIYERIRNLPYATDGAHHARGLEEHGRGNCVAKAQLLAEELTACGLVTRLVSWEYELPILVAVQRLLRFRFDVHTAVELKLAGTWTLLDTTHDPPLALLGLSVGHWEGISGTEPAYPPLGPVIAHDGPDAASRIDEMTTRIGHHVEATDPALVNQYRRDLNELFEQARRQAAAVPAS